MSLCGAPAAARSPISLDVLQRDGSGTVELLQAGPNRLFVPAEINGEKIKLLLDTGWAAPGITVGIDPSKLHITPEKGAGTMQSASGARTIVGHGVAQSVAMGNVRIEGAPIFFGRFSGIGFVGRGFLRKNNAIIDLTNLRLYLRPPGKGRRVDLTAALTAIGMAEVPFSETARGSFVVNVEVNGVPAQMALDTGSQATVLDVRFAKVAGTRGWGRNVRQLDAAGVVSPADFAGTKSFKIEGIPIRTPTVAISNFAGYNISGGKMVGVLGLDVIGLNWGIIDFAQQKFYFTKAN
jgi:predicted aspartyl protease